MTSVPFVHDRETRFTLPVAEGEAIHALEIETELEATLSIPVPPLTQLTHHPERTEFRTKTVSLWRPGTSRTVSETVTVTHDDGTTTHHVVTAVLSIPGETVYRDVTLTIVHPERVDAEVVDREPLDRVPRGESLGMACERRLRRAVSRYSSSSGAGARRAAGRADAGRRRPAPLVRRIRMGVAVVRRAIAAALAFGGGALSSRAPPLKRKQCFMPSTAYSRRWPTPPPASASSPSSGRASS